MKFSGFLKVSAALLTVMVLSACSTSPVTSALAEDTADISDATYLTRNYEEANIIVVRDKGILGMACGVSVFLDGKKVAVLGAGKRVMLKVSAEEHIVGAKLGCDMGTRVIVEALADVSNGVRKNFRVSTSSESGTLLMPTAF